MRKSLRKNFKIKIILKYTCVKMESFNFLLVAVTVNKSILIAQPELFQVPGTKS